MPESKDLEEGYYSVENASDWLHCPHCGNEDIELDNFGRYSEHRTTVNCPQCEANGFFD